MNLGDKELDDLLNTHFAHSPLYEARDEFTQATLKRLEKSQRMKFITLAFFTLLAFVPSALLIPWSAILTGLSQMNLSQTPVSLPMALTATGLGLMIQLNSYMRSQG